MEVKRGQHRTARRHVTNGVSIVGSAFTEEAAHVMGPDVRGPAHGPPRTSFTGRKSVRAGAGVLPPPVGYLTRVRRGEVAVATGGPRAPRPGSISLDTCPPCPSAGQSPHKHLPPKLSTRREEAGRVGRRVSSASGVIRPLIGPLGEALYRHMESL